MKNVMKYISNCRGSGVLSVILIGSLLVFIIFPVFSIVIEKCLLNIKAQQIKATIDITNIATYNAIEASQLSKNNISINKTYIQQIFEELLMKNLKLNADMTPTKNSIAEGQVKIQSIEVYTGSFPITCPMGNEINRTSVHSVIVVPIKPSLYREIILSLMNKEHIEMIVHVDSELPIDK